MKIQLKYVSLKWARTKWRFRFQCGGVKVTLPGVPGDPMFARKYPELMGKPVPEPESAIKDSLTWLVGLYLDDTARRVEFGLASPLTLKGHRHHLGRLVDAHGGKTVEMPSAHLLRFLDTYSKTPSGRDNLKKSVSAMYERAITRGYVNCPNPAEGIAKLKPKTSGFYTCTGEDVCRYLAYHQSGTMARRCMNLVLSAVARREVLRNLGPGHEFIRDGKVWLRWTQSKAPHDVAEIPMLSMLRGEVQGCQTETYLTNSKGERISHAMIGNYVQ